MSRSTNPRTMVICESVRYINLIGGRPEVCWTTLRHTLDLMACQMFCVVLFQNKWRQYIYVCVSTIHSLNYHNSNISDNTEMFRNSRICDSYWCMFSVFIKVKSWHYFKQSSLSEAWKKEVVLQSLKECICFIGTPCIYHCMMVVMFKLPESWSEASFLHQSKQPLFERDCQSY